MKVFNRNHDLPDVQANFSFRKLLPLVQMSEQLASIHVVYE